MNSKMPWFSWNRGPRAKKGTKKKLVKCYVYEFFWPLRLAPYLLLLSSPPPTSAHLCLFGGIQKFHNKIF